MIRTIPPALQLAHTSVKKRYSSAVSPTLTPITASSTYSETVQTPCLTPFDSQDSFELDLHFAHDRGEYVFSIDTSRYKGGRDNCDVDQSWSEHHYHPNTPDMSTRHSAGDQSISSISSCDSEGPATMPCTPDQFVQIGCDSPTIPGMDYAYFAAEPDLQHVLVNESAHQHKQLDLSPQSGRSRTRPSLLSPITIVLDTIQEHAFVEVAERQSLPTLATTRKSSPRNNTFPAVDLYATHFAPSSRPSSLPTRDDHHDIVVSHASPVSTRPPRPVRPLRQVKSEEKLGRLLGPQALPMKCDRRTSSFGHLPFQARVATPTVKTWMYDMI